MAAAWVGVCAAGVGMKTGSQNVEKKKGNGNVGTPLVTQMCLKNQKTWRPGMVGQSYWSRKPELGAA
jgi:hypothetical protein